MAYDVPTLGRQASVRIDDQMRKDLLVLLAARGDTVSDILKKAVHREAEDVRQAWIKAEEETGG